MVDAGIRAGRASRWWGLALGLLGACRQFDAPPPQAQAEPRPLQATPDQATVAPLGRTQVSVQGGTPGYQLDWAPQGFRSGGTLQGLDYQAGPVGGVTDLLRVTDAAGRTATVPISVSPALALLPQGLALPVGGAVDFIASGGAEPRCFGLARAPGCADAGAWSCPGQPPACLEGDGGSCVSAAGHYQAGPGSAQGTDWVSARDANGACASANVQVGRALQLAGPAEPLAPGAHAGLAVSGGLAPYTFAFTPHGNLSDGAVDATGQYTAGPNPNQTDTLLVTDAVGAQAQATVAVGDPEVDLPPQGYYLLRSANLNGDRYPDLLAVSTSNVLPEVVVLLGGGLSPAPAVLSLPNQICYATTTDLNGDGYDDLVLTTDPGGSGACQQVEVYLGSLGGSLSRGPSLTLPSYQDFPTPPWALAGAVTAADLTQGPMSLVVPVSQLPCTSTHCDRLVFLQLAPDGGGPFSTQLGPQPLQEVGWVDLPTTSTWLASAGGRPDPNHGGLLALSSVPAPEVDMDPVCEGQTLAVQHLAVSGLTLAGGKVTGQVQLLDSAPFPCPLNPVAFVDASFPPAVLDLDHDGRLDVGWFQLTETEAPSTFSYALGTGADFGPARQVALPAYSSFATAGPGPGVSAAAEVATVGPGAASRWRWSAEDGGLVPVAQSGLPDNRYGVLNYDLNQDRTPDLAVLDYQGRLRVLLGSPDGRVEHPRQFYYGGVIQGALGGDLDGDGRDDLALYTDQLQLFLGAPAPAGDPPVALATGPVLPLPSAMPQLTYGQGSLWMLAQHDGSNALLQLAKGGVAQAVPTDGLAPLPFSDVQVVAGPAGAARAVLVGHTHPGRQVLALDLGPDGVLDGGVGSRWTNDSAGTVTLVDARGRGTPADLAAAVLDGQGNPAVGIYPAQQLAPLSWAEDGGPPTPVTLPPNSGASGGGRTEVLLAYPLKSGQAPDHLAGLYHEYAAGSPTFAEVWFPPTTSAPTAEPVVLDVSAFYCPIYSANLRAADLNGDGNTDLIVFEGYQCAEANVLLGDGQGHFRLLGGRSVPLGGVYASDVLPLDLGPEGTWLAAVRQDTPYVQLLQLTDGGQLE